MRKSIFLSSTQFQHCIEQTQKNATNNNRNLFYRSFRIYLTRIIHLDTNSLFGAQLKRLSIGINWKLPIKQIYLCVWLTTCQFWIETFIYAVISFIIGFVKFYNKICNWIRFLWGKRKYFVVFTTKLSILIGFRYPQTFSAHFSI